MKCLTYVLVAAAVMFAAPAFAQQYDLVINGGRVMDPETMYDDIANVGIKDGRIAAITKNAIAGKETINAKDLVVAPGFIDTHFHAIDPFGTKLGVADGITTGMDLETGAMPVRDWYASREKNGNQINYGTTTALARARMEVHDPEIKLDPIVDSTNAFSLGGKAGADGVPGWSVSRSNIKQMNRIMKMLDEDLREGALGVGVPAAYMARGLTSYEQFEV
ncbi:MAG: aminoacylase, partial [Acidobacteriota bacterium]